MEINDFRVIGNLEDRFSIEPLGDLHVGNINCDKEKIVHRIKTIQNDSNRYTVIMGDLADCITMDDKRFDLQTIDPYLMEPDRQYEYVIGLLEPIKDKIIGIHTGNHDDTLRKKIAKQLRGIGYSEEKVLQDSDWVQRVCNELGVKYLGFSAFTRLTFQDTKRESDVVQFKIFSTHGQYGGTKTGGNINRVEDYASAFDADVYLSAHTHNIIGSKRMTIGVNQRGRKLVERTQLFAVTGGFLRGYVEGQPSYVEQSVRRPLRCGTITIDVKPRTRSLNIHE